MIAQTLYAGKDGGISDERLRQALEDSLADCRGRLKKVLLIPPDFTRLHSMAGRVCTICDELLRDACRVDILPALGTHAPLSREQAAEMLPGIAFERLLVHNWRTDTVKLGEVPAAFVREVSEGLLDTAIPVEVNRRLVEGGYDLILSAGQVVPHEVVGMANYSKNIFVGVGGREMINASHILGAFYGLERIMGRERTPVRRVFDYAQEHFLNDIPLEYALTVTTTQGEQTSLEGLFLGEGRRSFEKAAALSQEKNICFVERPIQKAVAWLDPAEFHTTWIGNKAIYRTRMALADGGELLILAPGVRAFGEDAGIDALIRKYGFRGREETIRLYKANRDLRENQGAAAHLIHSSTDGRFRVTYCTKALSEAEVRRAGFGWMDYDEAAAKYLPADRRDGFHTLPDGEEIYFIGNPALGLWAERERFESMR